MSSSRFKARVLKNQEIIQNLDREKYPYLSEYFRPPRKSTEMLVTFMNAMIENVHGAYVGDKWYIVSRNHLVKNYGFTRSTWNSVIIVCRVLGLIQARRPDKNTEDPRIKTLYDRAKSKTDYVRKCYDRPDYYRRAPLLYSVPAYTRTVLQKANEICKEWKESGVSYGHVTKSSVIMALGNRQANRTYLDHREVSTDQQAKLDYLRYVVALIVRERGYARKGLIIYTAREMAFKENVERERANAQEYDTEEMIYSRALVNLTAIAEVWSVYYRSILSDLHLQYRTPRKEERERLELGDSRSWIIVGDQTWETDPPALPVPEGLDWSRYTAEELGLNQEYPF